MTANRFCVTLLAWSALFATPVHAESLRDAIMTAIASNPQLRGEQDTVRGTAEGSVQARAAWQPVISITAGAQYLREPYDSVDFAYPSVETNNGTAALNLSQPVYTGGKIAAQVRAADALTKAGGEALRATEAQVIQSVVTSYMDVLRDSTILDIRRADLASLRLQVANTRARYNLGDAVTLTDVAQAETQQQAAAAAEAAAQQQLDTSNANYLAVVGEAPSNLVMPARLPDLPGSVDEALQRAAVGNPTLAESKETARAAGADVDVARAADLPNVAIQASYGAIGPVSPFHTGQYQQNISAMVTLTQSLYSGGLISSQIRAAEDQHEADQQAAEGAARQADQAVRTAWSQVRNGEASITAGTAEVEAAKTALRGDQAEYQYGLRSTLDVLIADQNLRAAQVGLVQSRHDTIVAEATLLEQTGNLEANELLESGGW